MRFDVSTRRAMNSLRLHELQRIVMQLHLKFPEITEAIRKAMRSWLLQILRRHPKMSIPLLTKLAARIAATLSAEAEPLHYHGVRDSLRFAARILSKDCDEQTFSETMAALQQPFCTWSRELSLVHERAMFRFIQRRDAAVLGASLSGHISQFIRYLSQVTGYPVVPFRFDAFRDSHRTVDTAVAARSEILAYCDGYTIHLPPCLAIARDEGNSECKSDDAHSQSRELNAIFLAYYLTLHEFLHLAIGSWKFSFKSRRGRLIFRRLRPWRDNMKRRCSGGISKELRTKLQQEGIRVDVLSMRTSSDLEKLWRHFPNPQLAQWLFNAAEDGRIETTVARHWPGLWQIHRVIQSAYINEVRPTAACATPLQNLINAIGMLAAERVMRVTITRDHANAFEEAQKILTSFRKLPRRSVYDSILATLKLYTLLERTAAETQNNEELNGFRPQIDSEEISVRMELAERQEDTDLYDQSSRGSDDHFDVKAKGIWLPEWDGRQLIDRKVHVALHPLNTTKLQPQLPNLTTAFPPVELNRLKSRLNGGRRWHDYGQFLATERLATIAPYRSLGGSPFAINYDLVADRAPLRVTMLIDLSISMEAPRHCLDGDTPLSRAVQGAMWMSRHLEALGVEVVAYGASDGGPRLCQLFTIPQPVSKFLPVIRCIGVAGFRTGAFVRAIAESPAELGMKPFNGRHILMIFTDTDRHYLSISNESIFEGMHKSNCPNCTSRHRCSVETADGAINPRKSDLGWLFAPPAYELADVDNALSAASNLEVVINYFGPRLPYAGHRETRAKIFHCNSGDVWPTVARETFAPRTTQPADITPRISAGK